MKRCDYLASSRTVGARRFPAPCPRPAIHALTVVTPDGRLWDQAVGCERCAGRAALSWGKHFLVDLRPLGQAGPVKAGIWRAVSVREGYRPGDAELVLAELVKQFRAVDRIPADALAGMACAVHEVIVEQRQTPSPRTV